MANHRDRWPEVILTAWVGGVLVALLLTLDSLRQDDFDGLNNVLQLPFALPWILLAPMVGLSVGNDHVLNAYVDAGVGLFNGALLYMGMRWFQRWERNTS